MEKEARLALYDAFAIDYLQAVREYTASRPNQRAKAPWQALVDTGLKTLQDIPPNEFAPKAYWLLQAYPELEKRLIAITDFLPVDATLVERQYCAYNGLTERPHCKHCGAQLAPKRGGKFRFVEAKGGKVKSGYGDYCNIKCASAADETVAKRKETNIQRYGGTTPAKSPKVVAKMRATTLARHGATSYAQTEASKTRFTELFGGATPFASADVQGRVRATNLERHGVENPMSVQSLADKAGAGRMRYTYHRLTDPERVGNVEPMFTEDEYMGVMQDRERGVPHRYPWRCKTCGTEFMDSLETDSSSGHNQPRCPQCFPQYVSMGEAALRDIVADAVDGHEVVWGDRTLLEGHEIDILVPGLKLAIEYNGLYWHSELSGGKGETYHHDKLERLAAIGYRLLYVWEDEWFDQPEAIQHVVTNACGAGMHVSARDCDVITGSAYNASVDIYHRDGSLGGVVTTYALISPAGAAVATLQVAQRPSRVKGLPSMATLRYTVNNGFLVTDGFITLFEAVLSKTRGSKLFRADLDPSFDDTVEYQRAGFELSKENKQPQQWFLARPYKYRRRLSKLELIERIKEVDPTFRPDTQVYASRLHAVGADRIWGVKRQVWEYRHEV